MWLTALMAVLATNAIWLGVHLAFRGTPTWMWVACTARAAPHVALGLGMIGPWMWLGLSAIAWGGVIASSAMFIYANMRRK